MTEPYSRPKVRRRRRRVASRLISVQALTLAIVAVTSVALVLYFILTER